MTITADTTDEVLRTDTTSPQTWSHTGAGSGVKGVVVSICKTGSATDDISAVTYGGVAMTRVQRNTDTAGEAGSSEIWFLGASVPQGTQTVSATCGATTDDIGFFSISLLAAGDLEVIDQDGISENTQNPAVTLQYGGRSAMSFAALYCGLGGPAQFTFNGNCTDTGSFDFGVNFCQIIRQTTAGTADFEIGGTSTGDDDVAFAAIAVSEISAGSAAAAHYYRASA